MPDERQLPEPAVAEEPRSEEKKLYVAPKLVVHGSVRDITKALPSGASDGVTSGSHL